MRNILDRLRQIGGNRYLAIIFMYIVMYILLRHFENGLPITDIHVDYLQKHIRRCADALLLTLPLWFIRKRGFVTVYVFLAGMYVFSNILYNRTYHTLMPMSSYLMVDNLNGLGESILNSFMARDIVPAISIATFLLYYWWAEPKMGIVSKRIRFTAAIVSTIAISTAFCPYYIRYGSDDIHNPLHSYRNDKVGSYLIYGFTNYWIYSIGANSKPTQKEIGLVNDYFSKYQHTTVPLINNDSTNLIVILVESMQSWPIGLKVDGKEVTPYLNSLMQGQDNLFFLNVLPQVKHGRSSDAQLLINTGLLPINDGATAYLYGDNSYLSLPKALAQKGYKSYSLICDDREYWNQEMTCHSYGFDDIYDRLGDCSDATNWIHADEHLVRYAAEIVPKLKSPFYAQIVTMSGHDVVNSDLQNDFSDISLDNQTLKNQLIIYRYEDEQIGYLIDRLKESGIYDKSVVVITGDHDSIGRDILDGRSTRQLSDRFIPFIILNSPLKTDTDMVIGQMDIYPSLLDIMGLDYGWRGLGESIFRSPMAFAVYRTGETVGDEYPDSIVEAKSRLWDISDIIIRQNYFNLNF